MILAFVRHGQTDWNRERRSQGRSDIPLNDTGREQARALVPKLLDGGWDLVLSSPLSRARETARIVADGLALPLGPSYPEFTERDYGPHEGGSDVELMRRYPKHDYPGAELPEALVQRSLTGIARIEQDFSDKRVLLVCHGTVIWYTLIHLIGAGLAYVPNGGMVVLEGSADTWRLLGEPSGGF